MSMIHAYTHTIRGRNSLRAGLTGTAVSLSTTRWLVPWIAVLFASATLAYAMTSALHAGGLASNQQPLIDAAVSTGAAATVSPVEGSRMSYVGLNTWTPAEPSTPQQTNWSTPA